MTKHKLIIDTDPGVDDVLGLLLALSLNDLIDLELISICFGNVHTSVSLRNVVAMFDVLREDVKFRGENHLETHAGYTKIYDKLDKKPVLAVGAGSPLVGNEINADYFHGIDGLGNVTRLLPEYAVDPDRFDRIWSRVNNDGGAHLFSSGVDQKEQQQDPNEPFILSSLPSHKEILRILQENPVDTVTIAAIGPLTNIALAAIEDPQVFSRVRCVISMGGCLNVPGNITPVGEFNVYADPYAAAIVYSLSGKDPKYTLPPPSELDQHIFSDPARKRLVDYFASRDCCRQLKLVLFPLDVTSIHLMTHSQIREDLIKTKPHIQQTPLYKWVDGFLKTTFARVETLYEDDEIARQEQIEVEEQALLQQKQHHHHHPLLHHHHHHHGTEDNNDDDEDDDAVSKKVKEPGLEMHDPLVVYYAILTLIQEDNPQEEMSSQLAKFRLGRGKDIRIETAGQWTRGECVMDKRGRRRAKERVHSPSAHAQHIDPDHASLGTRSLDPGAWLDPDLGNRVTVPIQTGISGTRFAKILLDSIF